MRQSKNSEKGSVLIMAMSTLLVLTFVAYSIGRYQEGSIIPVRKSRIVSVMNEVQARVLYEVQKPKYYVNCGPSSFGPTGISPVTMSHCGVSAALNAALGEFARRPVGVPCPANDGSCFVSATLANPGELPPATDVHPSGLRLNLDPSVTNASSVPMTFVVNNAPPIISKLYVHAVVRAPAGMNGNILKDRPLTIEVPPEVFTSQSGLCPGNNELFVGFDQNNQPICRTISSCPAGESFKGLKADSHGNIESQCQRMIPPAPSGPAGDPPSRCRALSPGSPSGVTADGKALCCTGNNLMTGVNVNAANQFIASCAPPSIPAGFVEP